jgi:hypothetical protein
MEVAKLITPITLHGGVVEGLTPSASFPSYKTSFASASTS